MDVSLARTPLFEWHSEHGGRLVDFAGWSMPIQYTSISDEHVATRTAAALFDVSHMGRFFFEGEAAGEWLQSLVTRNIANQAVQDVRYSLVTRDDGGVLDDILVYRMPPSAIVPHAHRWMLVVNASNRSKIWDWLEQHQPPALDRRVDETAGTAMIAVQGPIARRLVIETLKLPQLEELKNYQVTSLEDPERAGREMIVSRTGYTGEDGFELIVPAERAESVWDQLIVAGADEGVVPAGLGARDTLRLEAAMPLYGHELGEERSAATAGLDFAIDLKHDFPGRDQLAADKEVTEQPVKRVGFVMDAKRVAREGANVFVGDNQVGEVTSGTFSPTLQQAIGMAYVEHQVAEIGQSIEIDIRGKRAAARVVKLPFYRRPKNEPIQKTK